MAASASQVQPGPSVADHEPLALELKDELHYRYKDSFVSLCGSRESGGGNSSVLQCMLCMLTSPDSVPNVTPPRRCKTQKRLPNRIYQGYRIVRNGLDHVAEEDHIPTLHLKLSCHIKSHDFPLEDPGNWSLLWVA